MKKIFLLAITFLLCSLSYAQEITYFFEGFDDGKYDRWTFDRQTNWIMETSNWVGNSAPEAAFAYLKADEDALKGTARMMSAWYSTKNDTNLYLAMNYAFIASTSNATDKSFGLAVRTSKNADWVTIFEKKNAKSMQSPAASLIKLDKAFQNVDSVQVCAFVSSKTAAPNPLYMVYFDDIQFFAIRGTGAQLASTTPEVFMPIVDSNLTVNGVLTNKGLVMDSCILNYQVDNEPIVALTYRNLRLGPTQIKKFAFPSAIWKNTVGPHILKIWISNINGAAPKFMIGGDTLVQALYVPEVGAGVPSKLLLESFSSSTCPPCASFNSTTMAPLLEKYKGQFTLVKYQMNGPGSGDPYFIKDGGIRYEYYGLNSVPSLLKDGSEVFLGSATIYSLLAKAIENAPKTKALFEIKEIQSKISDTGLLTLRYTILPFVTTNKTTVQSVVFENKTFKNATSNGEKEFDHITMAMLPDGNGKDVQFIANQAQTFEYSLDMKKTFVEELYDLSVAIFVQDEISHNVYQSADAFVTRADTGAKAKAVAFRNHPYSPNLTLPILGTIKNLGDAITSVEIAFQADGGAVSITKFTDLNLEWQDEYDFTLPNWTGTVGTHNWKFWISKINGNPYTNNVDTAKITIELIASDIPFRPLIEEFTSSTCIPCKDLNDKVVNPLYTEFTNQLSLVKYPMNTPGTGDPYYTAEYLKRAALYDAKVESVVFDGALIQWTDTTSTAKSMQLKTDLQAAIAQKSLFEISKPSITIGALGSTFLDVEYVITPKSAGKYMVTNILVEGETVKNDRTNGEVSFINTAMKVFPTVGGSMPAIINFKKNVPYTYSTRVLYKILKIEEPSDLILISVIQDVETLNVMQSAQNNVVDRTSNEAMSSFAKISLYPNPANSTTQIKLNEMSTLRVFDMTGRMIFEKQNVEGVYTMDVSTFAQGSYVLKASSASSISTIKLNVIK